MAGDHLAFFEEHDFGRAAAHLQNHRVRACKKRAFILKRFLYREIHEVGFFDVLDDADVKTGLKIDAVDERVSVGRFPERARADHLNVRRLQAISLQKLAEGAQDGNSLAQAVPRDAAHSEHIAAQAGLLGSPVENFQSSLGIDFSDNEPYPGGSYFYRGMKPFR
jgi:hypothetical protein